jgi:hypothetical protein
MFEACAFMVTFFTLTEHGKADKVTFHTTLD